MRKSRVLRVRRLEWLLQELPPDTRDLFTFLEVYGLRLNSRSIRPPPHAARFPGDIAEYTFCQERDLFNGVRCCSGTDGDPSELNICAEGIIVRHLTDVWCRVVVLVYFRVNLFGLRLYLASERNNRRAVEVERQNHHRYHVEYAALSIRMLLLQTNVNLVSVKEVRMYTHTTCTMKNDALTSYPWVSLHLPAVRRCVGRPIC